MLVLMLLLGVAIWDVVFGKFASVTLTVRTAGPMGLAIAALVCVGLAFLAPVRWALLPGRQPQWWQSALAAALMALYLASTAIHEHRALIPYVHDEQSYLIQAHQLAHGRLWYPAHPLGQFFDSFQLLTTTGVYASAYFPGTALMYVPAVWLHVTPWIWSLAIAAAVAGLLHRVLGQMIDTAAAWVGLLLLISCESYRALSVMQLAQAPLLLWGLSAVAALLAWETSKRHGWIALIGLALGWAAIIRPVDALCFALPIVAALLVSLWRSRQLRTCGPLVILLLLFASPFLFLQLIDNRGITGHWLTTPFQLYASRDYPNTRYGFYPFDAAAMPLSPLPQKRAMYLAYRYTFWQHTWSNIGIDLLHTRLPITLALGGTTPFAELLVLVPAAVLAMRFRYRWVLLATLPLLILLYVPYPFFFPHYVLSAAPALILAPLITCRDVLPRTLRPIGRGARWGGIATAASTLLVAAVAIAAWPQWDASTNDDLFGTELMRAAHDQLQALPRPALVLFRYDPARLVHEEPVYNIDVPWPDDAPVIRAHDLGPVLDQRLFSYYAARQPQRRIYRFDEKNNQLTYLGTAAELAEHPRKLAGG